MKIKSNQNKVFPKNKNKDNCEIFIGKLLMFLLGKNHNLLSPNMRFI